MIDMARISMGSSTYSHPNRVVTKFMLPLAAALNESGSSMAHAATATVTSNIFKTKNTATTEIRGGAIYNDNAEKASVLNQGFEWIMVYRLTFSPLAFRFPMKSWESKHQHIHLISLWLTKPCF